VFCESFNYLATYVFSAVELLTVRTKSTIIINNAKDPRMAGIIYIFSYTKPPNQYPKTGEPSQAPIHPKITFETNESIPGFILNLST
jgi:hypothetical protein